MIGYEKAKAVFSICKHGVLHCEFYDADEKSQALAFFQENEFMELPDRCYDPVGFDDFDGRRILL
ncbi:MAG: hypothetical protein AB8F95_04080 [Bacteroidia bacterium]